MEDNTADAPTSSNALTILNAKQTAELLGLHVQTIYEWAQAGEIPCRRIGRRYVFVRERLEQWLMEGGLADS